MKTGIDFNTPAVYRIRLQESLESGWSEWFENLEIVRQVGGETLLTGTVADQAALHGLLRKVRDLGLTLVSLQRMESRQGKGESS